MKSIALITATIAVTDAQALLNLRNHHLLSSQEKLNPLETIAFIETFDEVPIFGGEELRAKMLEQAGKTKQAIFSLDTMELTNSIQQGMAKVSKTVSTHVNTLTNKVVKRAEPVSILEMPSVLSSEDLFDESSALTQMVSATISLAAAVLILQ